MDAKRRRRRKAVLLELLREMRASHETTQSDLATRLGRPQSYVSKYESGEHRLDLFELEAICDALGASLQELIRDYTESDERR